MIPFPKFEDALRLYQSGQFPSALDMCREILKANPWDPEAAHLYGLVAAHLRQSTLAFDMLRQAIRLKPDYAEAYNNLGSMLGMRKIPEELAEAETCFRKAVELQPRFVDARFNLGVTQIALAKFEEAISTLQEALKEQPNAPVGHYNLGVAFKNLERFEEAEAHFQHAVQANPEYVDGLYSLANIHKKQGRLDDAILEYQRLLKLQPNHADALNNLGNALNDLGRFAEGVACLQQVLRINPKNAGAYNNLGIALEDQGMVKEAAENFRRAIPLDANYADAHKALGMVLLLQGQFEQGWEEYEWRWQTKSQSMAHFAQPPWNGSDLRGRTILLWAEQGLGDTLQFIRYAALVRAQGARVIVACPEKLHAILSRTPGIDQIVSQDAPLPSYDEHVPLMSLPRIFRTTVNNIPNQGPYVFAYPALIEHWGQQLRSFAEFKIGIVWQGNARYPKDRWRSFPLTHFEVISQIPGVLLVSLQKGDGAKQSESANFAMIQCTELDERTGTFMDSAALMKGLDLIITSDTSLAHLAGALGVPVWLGLPFAPDWRWLLEREDCPWYPTMRLFRQREFGNWHEVFSRMADELRQQVARK